MPRVVGALCQELGSKTKYVCFLTSHLYIAFLLCVVKETAVLTLVHMVRKALFSTPTKGQRAGSVLIQQGQAGCRVRGPGVGSY